MATAPTIKAPGTIIDSERKRFELLMSRSYKKVFDLAYRLSRSRTDAEDLTQEAFVRAMKAFHTFEGDRPFENWIFRIVTRLFLDLRRSRARRVQTVSYDVPFQPHGGSETVQFDPPDNRTNALDELTDGVLSPKVEAAVKTLSPDQRQLIWMADVEELPYKEIAERLGSPIGTVRSRLHRAHKLLRKQIAELG